MPGNDAAYRKPRIVGSYQRMAATGLTPPEKCCLDLLPASHRHSVLDIGIGAGRTTAELSKMFETYVGIDYSDNMITAARSLFPGIDLRVMDARKLEFIEPFDCVIFSYNGIDYVDHADRQLILRQIAKVLRPGGYFMYSTHNLIYWRTAIWMNHLWVKELLHPARRIRFIPNRMKNFWRQSLDEKQSIAYVNDPGDGFIYITCYVDLPGEIHRLHQHGFEVLATIGNKRQTAGYDANDNWIYILTRRS